MSNAIAQKIRRKAKLLGLKASAPKRRNEWRRWHIYTDGASRSLPLEGMSDNQALAWLDAYGRSPWLDAGRISAARVGVEHSQE